MVEHKDFFNRVMLMISKHPEQLSNRESCIPCSLYSAADHNRYTYGQMPAEDVLLFEEHSWNCNACLHGIHHSFEKMTADNEQKENDALLQRTFVILDRLDKSHVNNLLEMVIRASGKVIELLSTTGELLRETSYVPIRGETATSDMKESLRIVQEFNEPHISIQASVELDKEDGGLCIIISLYDQEKEVFMPGVGITLEGTGSPQETISDENGEALLRIGKPGEYRMAITSGAIEIGEVFLTIL